jgi:hypothetical protein
VDEAAKEVKEIFSRYNGTLLVTDPAAASPRSLAVVAPARGSKNLTVEWRAVGVLLQWWTYPAALLVSYDSLCCKLLLVTLLWVEGVFGNKVFLKS